MLLLLETLLLSALLSPGLLARQNKVIAGPGYEKGQKSQKKLLFVMPTGWVRDDKAAEKLGLDSVLVPHGMTVENADKVITVAFQMKDLNKSGLENLENFFKVDLQNTLAEFPDAQFARWQPSKLDPDKIEFMSIEMFGKKKDKPSPQHFLILDSGDGFFSVGLTVEKRPELQLPIYEDFFNSISLGPQS